MSVLQDKVAIVTGASSGIGRATAQLLAAEGAAVILNARGLPALEDTAAAIRKSGGTAHVVSGDAGLTETHEQLVEIASREFGRLDIAINNVGAVGPFKPLADVSPEEWQATVSVNLTSAFFGARNQIPAMLKNGGGSIVFISTFVGTSVGIPGMTAYAASKAGLMGLVKGITADYGANGIRANALLPGGTDTPAAGDAAQKEWAAGLHAMKRIARPDEIAQAAMFLASPMSSFVSGAALFADGGNSAVK